MRFGQAFGSDLDAIFQSPPIATVLDRRSLRLRAKTHEVAESSTPEVFRRLEDLLVQNLNTHNPGGRLDWERLAGCWVLRPPAAASEAVVVFVGDAFIGMHLRIPVCHGQFGRHYTVQPCCTLVG